jgi:MFS family permease
MNQVNASKLFTASCFALITTSMSFAIRAGILAKLGIDFGLSNEELGYITSMAFLGFPIATMIGGPIYNAIGPKKIMWMAFICHLLGIVLTIFAGGFWTLLISTFFVGFANGTVEAACNPMIADLYPNNKTTMLNKFHVWFPGGIVLGSLISQAMTSMNMGWQLQIAVMLIPTLIYGYLIMGQEFPKSENIEGSTEKNFNALLSPLYLIMAFCMTLTATTELNTQQWVEKLLGQAGAQPMLILALVTGLMAVGRYFAGPVIHRLNPLGVLLGSAIFAAIGIYMMSQAEGAMTYVAAVFFAIGVCYFWPTMIGFVAEYLPKTGALGMSLMGGAGMFAVSLWQPITGRWLDSAKANAIASGLDENAANLAAGQSTLSYITIFPLILIVVFGALYMNRAKIMGQTEAAKQI